jgi:hypothetical protein
LSDRIIDSRTFRSRQPAAAIDQRWFDRIRERVDLVARIDQLPTLLILGRVTCCFLHKAIDFVLCQATRGRDRDPPLLSGGQILPRQSPGALVSSSTVAG